MYSHYNSSLNTKHSCTVFGKITYTFNIVYSTNTWEHLVNLNIIIGTHYYVLSTIYYRR